VFDLHTHTLESDGELLPSELVRRYAAIGCRGVALTDHADATNLRRLVSELSELAPQGPDFGVVILAGVELTHVPPARIAEMARWAKGLGAQLVVVHGETTVEPVAPGTNLAALRSPDVDMLAHPGRLTDEQARLAAERHVLLEVTSRGGHSLTNAHVVSVARAAGAGLVINSDAHGPGDLMDAQAAEAVGRAAGMTDAELRRALTLALELVQRRSI